MEQDETLIRSRNDLNNFLGRVNKGEVVLTDSEIPKIKETFINIIDRASKRDYKFMTILFIFMNLYKGYEVCEVDTLHFAKRLDEVFADLIKFRERGEINEQEDISGGSTSG